ncbi:MAG: hypothetical protein G01um1014107_213, partial [Parcubacteria group bacterium Gr01-1014_107]
MLIMSKTNPPAGGQNSLQRRNGFGGQAKFKTGVSLLEMVVYISIMALILVVVTSTLLVTLSS